MDVTRAATIVQVAKVDEREAISSQGDIHMFCTESPPQERNNTVDETLR